jgi:hypothetical protein
VSETARLIDALYRENRDFARRLLVGTRAEVDTELEDLAHRWRPGRMADLGFADFYEALEVYSEIDPASVRIGGSGARGCARWSTPRRREPPAPARRAGGAADRRSPFARGLGAISQPEELAEIHHALVAAVQTRALSADRVTPGDHETLSAVLGRVADTLDLPSSSWPAGSESGRRPPCARCRWCACSRPA